MLEIQARMTKIVTILVIITDTRFLFSSFLTGIHKITVVWEFMWEVKKLNRENEIMASVSESGNDE